MERQTYKALFADLAKIKQGQSELRDLFETLHSDRFSFIDPFEYVARLDGAILLLYHKGTYFDRKGRDKTALWERLGITTPNKTNFMRDVSDADLPAYLKQYEIEVALAKELTTGDMLTTLGHIISPKTFSIRVYKSRINNYITLQKDGEKKTIHLGILMVKTFIDDFDPATQMVWYKDNNFSNNRIENLFIGRKENDDE